MSNIFSLFGADKEKNNNPGFKTLQKVKEMTVRRFEEVEALKLTINESSEISPQIHEKYVSFIRAWNVFVKLKVFSKDNYAQGKILDIFGPYMRHSIDEKVYSKESILKNLDTIENYCVAILKQLDNFEKNFDFKKSA